MLGKCWVTWPPASIVDLACIWTCPTAWGHPAVACPCPASEPCSQCTLQESSPDAAPRLDALQTARNTLLALLQQAKQQARQQAQQATTPRGVAYALPPQQQAGGYRPQVSLLPLHSGVTLPSPTETQLPILLPCQTSLVQS